MSDIKIINAAFRKIGEHGLSGTDQTPNGIEAAKAYDAGLELLLSMHDWNFAVKRQALAPDLSAPQHGYAYAYTLPADLIKIRKIGHGYKTFHENGMNIYPDVAYEIEGGKILTDVSNSIDITYIKKETNSACFSPLFREALVYYIAAEMCMFIKPKLQEWLNAMMDRCIILARRNNEIVRDIESLPDNSWVTARKGVSNFYNNEDEY